jgi:hypothetical protein
MGWCFPATQIVSVLKTSWVDSSLSNRNLLGLSLTEGKSLCIHSIERGKGFLRSVHLGRGVFWLLLTVDEVAWLDNSVGFIKKFKDSQSALLCQRSCNSYGAYLAIEEFSSGGLSFSSLKVSRSGDGVALLRCPFITVNHVIEMVWLC